MPFKEKKRQLRSPLSGPKRSLTTSWGRSSKYSLSLGLSSPLVRSELKYLLSFTRSNGIDHKLLKISYIISRRTSIDVFTGKSSDIGQFAKDLISKIADGKIMEGLGNLAGTLLNKLFGSASGSAQTERV